jgi:hypothetical protein
MRNVWTLVSLVGLCVGGAFPGAVARGAAAPQVGELTPTLLEAFAARPGAKVVWSRTIGHIEGPAARATVVAIAIEDLSSTPPVVRGLRLDLAHLEANPDCNLRFRDWAVLCARPNAAVYLEADRLERVRTLWVERGAVEVHPGNGGLTNYRRGGTQPATGLIICGYTLEGRQPEELTALLTQGLSALKDAPR